MIMDFWMQQLKNEGLFENHPRFMIKTTASARSWDEWAKKNMFEIDREALRVYEAKEATLLAALTTPTDLLMAA